MLVMRNAVLIQFGLIRLVRGMQIPELRIHFHREGFGIQGSASRGGMGKEGREFFHFRRVSRGYRKIAVWPGIVRFESVRRISSKVIQEFIEVLRHPQDILSYVVGIDMEGFRGSWFELA